MIKSGTSQPPIDWLILDGMFTMYRSYLSTPSLTSPKGFPTGAIHGFMGSMLSLVKTVKPTKGVIVALEGGASEREERDSSYKANRDPFPGEFLQQLPILHTQILPLLKHVYTLQNEGFEADDTIASCCKQLEGTKAIFTTDKDIKSLSSEDVFIIEKKKGKVFFQTPEDICLRWKVSKPSQILEILKIAGDKIDNVEGIPGLGIITATQLIAEYGTGEEVYKNLDKITKKALKTKLEKGYENWKVADSMIKLNRNLPIIDELYGSMELKSHPDFDKQALVQLQHLFLEELGIKTIFQRALNTLYPKDSLDIQI